PRYRLPHPFPTRRSSDLGSSDPPAHAVSELEQRLGRRFARFTTNVVVSHPRLWRLLRPLTRYQFDRLAPQWTTMRSGDAFAPLEQALDVLPSEPKRVLDLGTGTG